MCVVSPNDLAYRSYNIGTYSMNESWSLPRPFFVFLCSPENGLSGGKVPSIRLRRMLCISQQIAEGEHQTETYDCEHIICFRCQIL